MPTVLHIFTTPLSLRFIRGLPAHLRARGYHTTIVTSPGPALDAFLASEGCPGFAVDLPRRVTPLQDLAALARLVRIIRKVRPDIVHAHTPKGGLWGMMAATAARVPKRIYHMRGLLLATAKGPSRLVFHVTERVSCNLASRVLCVSHSLRKVAIDFGLTSPDRIQVLLGGSGQGIDATHEFFPGVVSGERLATLRSDLSIPADSPIVLFVGRLVRDKGIIDLAEAWRDIVSSVPSARLLLVGPYEPRDPVPPDVRRRLEQDPTVRHVGWTEKPAPYYALANVTVLPTYREGFPNVPLESAAMEVPVVATRIPGCVDAVADGETGTLVSTGSPAALADAILSYLRDPDRAGRHGEAGRKRVLAQFQREKIWDAIADVYDELLQSHSSIRNADPGSAS